MTPAAEPTPIRPTLRSLRSIKAQYTHGEERPLGSFAALMGGYAAAVAAAAAYIKRRDIALPDQPSWRDLTLTSIATYRLARLIAKDPVTSPLRAPFTRFEGQSGEAELAEQVVGRGPRKALGELVTCPFCLAQWVASAFAFGLVVRPRETRLAAGVFTVVAAADALQFAYDNLQQSVE